MARLFGSMDSVQRRAGIVLFGILLTFLLGLVGRVTYINAAMRPRFLALAERQHYASTTIPARRGTIYDAQGRPVAISRTMPDVFVDMAVVKDPHVLAEQLATRLNLPAGELERKMRNRPDSRFLVLATGVDEVTADAVAKIRTPGVGLSDRLERTYPLGHSLSHVLGWVGRDGAGLEGLEMAFDAHLRGRDGHRAFVCDAGRRGLFQAEDESVSPIDGGHLVLTIDAEVQRIAEESLDTAIRKFRAQTGVALVMSIGTGEMLAMASWPTFDPAEPVSERDKAVRRNLAVTDPIEPGSTFKPFVACGALEGGFVSHTEQIDCQMGSHYFGKRLVTDVKPYGLMDLRGILAKSSNIGMGIIATRMGNPALFKTIRNFGFGERTGIECPGEDSGVVYPLRQWNSYSTTSVAMGYEVLVTPLQLITAFCSVVNEGLVLKPRITRQLLSADGGVVSESSGPQVVRRAISRNVARFMAYDLLVSVVEQGGGQKAKVGPYQVLGKTGTAKLLGANRRTYETGAYQGAFMGAAPATNPQIATLVVIRRPDPNLGYYGGTIAAEPAGEILAKTLAYLGVPPDDAVSGH